MKKNALLLVFLFFSFCYAQQRICPYEVDGLVGFVNPDTMRVTRQPEFQGLVSCSEYCAVVYDSSYRRHIITSSQDFIVENGDCALIGNALYSYTQKTTDGNMEVTIKSALTDEEYHFQKYIEYDFLISPSETYLVCENPYDKAYPRYQYVNKDGNFLNSSLDIRELSPFDDELQVGAAKIRTTRIWKIINADFTFHSDKDFTLLSTFSDGLIFGQSATECGFFDSNGNLVISTLKPLDLQFFKYLPGFVCGRIPCTIENGSYRIRTSFDYTQCSDWAVIDTEGRIVKSDITARYLSEFSRDGVSVMENRMGTKSVYSLINTSGEMVTKGVFDMIQPSVNGFCRAKKGGADYLISIEDGSEYKCSDLY